MTEVSGFELDDPWGPCQHELVYNSFGEGSGWTCRLVCCSSSVVPKARADMKAHTIKQKVQQQNLARVVL